MSYNYLLIFDNLIKDQMSDIQTCTIRLKKIEASIEDIGIKMEKNYNAIRCIELEKEKDIKKFSILREYLSRRIFIY